jgi:hypothetical protein
MLPYRNSKNVGKLMELVALVGHDILGALPVWLIALVRRPFVNDSYSICRLHTTYIPDNRLPFNEDKPRTLPTEYITNRVT